MTRRRTASTTQRGYASDRPVLRLEDVASPIGTLLVVTDDAQTLIAITWEDREHRLQDDLARQHGGPAARMAGPAVSDPARLLAAYFAGDLHALASLRVLDAGTEFQRAVWRALRDVPPGETVSYGELARRIGRPAAVRAVGMANGANPVPIVVPCHRVIGADGTLTGFGGGLDRKRWLLDHEGVVRPAEARPLPLLAGVAVG